MDISIFLIVFLLSVVCLVLILFPFVKLSFFLVEWEFLSFKIMSYFNSVIFSLILLLVTLSVLVFSTYYLEGELSFNYYYFMLLVFVGSIFSLVYSNRSFTILLRWDLLGISRFFLVLFYNN